MFGFCRCVVQALQYTSQYSFPVALTSFFVCHGQVDDPSQERDYTQAAEFATLGENLLIDVLQARYHPSGTRTGKCDKIVL